MEIQNIAKVYNMELKALCFKLVLKSDMERFLFLKSYYEKVNKEASKFYKNFHHYKSIFPSRSIPVKNVFKNPPEIEMAKGISNIDRKVSKTVRVSKLPSIIINSNLKNTNTGVKETPSTSTDVCLNKPFILENGLHNQKVNTSKNKVYVCEAHSSNSKFKTTKKINESEFESVITSVFLDDTSSKLKTILKNDSPEKSPNKYSTILESLLFD
ncbi:hypothetical protein Anas_09627 [Armadillidium nasatum]|uniref:Uncharacterized protein n=1 Tax=Armadillidium nasatum TaxID=96803 RepID=A0A5N5TMJ9_9CRUS|nr:hypothetical protein Anas_09627 [Armadillidium nasatum]